MAINYKELHKMSEGLEPAKFNNRLKECFASGQIKPRDFSIRRLAEVFMGHEFVEYANPKHEDPDRYIKLAKIKEAGSGVHTSTFSNITGQIVYSAIMEGYESAARVATRLVSTVSTNLSGEKIPGMQKLSDQGDDFIVNEGENYPNYGFGEDYIETPETVKRGFIVPVTLEAIFFDRTNLILTRASGGGETLGINKEKRLMDLILGITNNYKQTGTSYNTYRTTASADGKLPVNYLTDNELLDYTDIDAVQQTFNQMTDPYTGEPILIEKATMLVAQAKEATAKRVLNSTEIRVDTATNSITTIGDTPSNLTAYTLETSPYVQSRLVANSSTETNANKTWIVGDFSKAFAYMENWGITTAQAPTNNQKMFEQDIMQQYKVSERGAAAVIDPRYVVKSDATTA
jgi:hypothetical protein